MLGKEGVRTITISYDGAGRRSDTTVSSSIGTPIAKQHRVYDPPTGRLSTVQSIDTSNWVTASVAVRYDSLGRTNSYTDADNNTSTATYDLLSRPATSNDGKGTQTFSYNGGGELRGLPTQGPGKVVMVSGLHGSE